MDKLTMIAMALFPDELYPVGDCRSEYGREGQPCSVCADKRRDMEQQLQRRVTSVREALAAAGVAL